MRRGDRSERKLVMSRVGTAFWLLATILIAFSGSAAGFQDRPESLSVSPRAASLTSEARPAQPSVLPRGLPRVVASETHRQKAMRGHAGTTFGIIPEEVPLRVVIHQGFTPIVHSDVLWSVLVQAFEPRGPPSLIV
jgi:hypothetical protein